MTRTALLSGPGYARTSRSGHCTAARTLPAASSPPGYRAGIAPAWLVAASDTTDIALLRPAPPPAGSRRLARHPGLPGSECPGRWVDSRQDVGVSDRRAQRTP